MPKKNDIIELEITDITNDGNGIGKFDGAAVFVPMTAPNDKIKARIVKVLSKYSFGIILDGLRAIPQKVNNAF